MEDDPKILEVKAQALLAEDDLEEAFKLFKKAAAGFSHKKNYKQAAFCCATAASCWSIKLGEKTFYNSAACFEEAAGYAVQASDFEYAALLYKYAALHYERDGEYLNFSDCYYHSRECTRALYVHRVFRWERWRPRLSGKGADRSGQESLVRDIFSLLALTFSSYVWGHGERPFRTLVVGLGIIIGSALAYRIGIVQTAQGVTIPPFFEACYVSIITFTTVGYGDITPIGFARAVAALEALAGVIIMPLFIVGLSRKYLRMN